MDACACLAYHTQMAGPLDSLRAFGARRAEKRRRAQFQRSLRHVSGPTQITTGPEDVVLIVVLRDAAGYLDAFLDHYRALGVAHFAVLDNGSRDDTLDRLSAAPDVSVDQCDLPLADYLDLMRAYPAEHYGAGRWCLNVEVDEMLEFEGSSTIGIAGLVRYFNQIGATALMAQTLEMFPKQSPADLPPMTFRDVLTHFLYYDVSAACRVPYHGDHPLQALTQANTLIGPDAVMMFGGIWEKLFEENRPLTRHPLVFNAEGVDLGAHPHVPTGVRCADVTAVLKNYRFVNPTLVRSAEKPLFSLEARRWNRVELLARAGLVQVPDRYRAYLQERPS